MPDLETRMFQRGIVQARDTIFHGGEHANNHVDMERIINVPDELRDDVIDGVAKLVQTFAPDVLVGIPTGGTEIAELVSEIIRVPTARLEKVPQSDKTNKFEFTASMERKRVERLGRVVIIDDVATRLTTLERVMQVPELIGKAVGFVAILARAPEEERRIVPIDKKFLVERHIPEMLPSDSPFFGVTASS